VEIPCTSNSIRSTGTKVFTVIGVSMDDKGMKIVKPFLAEKHIEYPVVIGNDELAKQYYLMQMPMTLLIES